MTMAEENQWTTFKNSVEDDILATENWVKHGRDPKKALPMSTEIFSFSTPLMGNGVRKFEVKLPEDKGKRTQLL